MMALIIGTEFNDSRTGTSGNDTLVGRGGDDFLNGGFGNRSLDFIFENTASGGSGGSDIIFFNDISSSDAFLLRSGDGLFVTSNADVADGNIDEGAFIVDFFIDNTVELFSFNDDFVFDATLIM